MNSMTTKALKRLENIQNNIQITMYLPLLPGPENTAKNVSALHHALAVLRKTFIAEEVPASNQQMIVEHINKLEQELSHPMSGKSLAIFITDSNDMITYQLPFEVESAIYFLAPNMQLEPLKAHYHDTAAYWVLSLSQKGCTLFKGVGMNLKQVDASDISVDLKTALGLDEVNNPEVQTHAVGATGGHVAEGFHGHGGFKDLRKKYLENYLRLIDKRLDKHLRGSKDPVILVGVDYTQKLYAKLSHRRQLITSELSISAHQLSATSMRNTIMPLVSQL